MTQAARIEHPSAIPNALALIETAKPLELFSNNGLDPILEQIEKEARSIFLDISTPAGRKEIASLAFKIAKSKTALDAAGKALVSGWKEQAKKVDAERSRAWDRLEALQKEVRAPLTEWEDREKDRIADHESRLAEIVSAGRYTLDNWQTLSLEAMKERLQEIESEEPDWQEFAARARQATDKSASEIRSAIQKREAHDAEHAELARLRREEAERRQREHEERLKAEAAARAKAEAEEKARKEAEAQAAIVRAEQEKAERELLRIRRQKEQAEREKEVAEARARKSEEDRLAALAKAEADRMAAEEKAERDRMVAAEQAKRDAEAAAKAERDRIAAEQRKEREAAAKREADKKHRAKINGEVLAAFVAAGLPEDAARLAVSAIAMGGVPNVKISY